MDKLSFILTAAAAAKSLQLCPTLCNPIDSSPPGSCPWDSLGKNTGVGCHFLLQCVKVKSLSRVRLLVTPWTAAYQAPPPMGLSRQEYWSGVPLLNQIPCMPREQPTHWRANEPPKFSHRSESSKPHTELPRLKVWQWEEALHRDWL